MDRLIIEGGYPLVGDVQISGAKNSVLPILFASIMGQGSSVIRNIPHLRDVTTTIELLSYLGVRVTLGEHMALDIDPTNVNCFEATYDLAKTMRASVLLLGPLVARFGEAKVSMPGGCAIGSRPVGEHIDGLEKMGATIDVENGYLVARAEKLVGATIDMSLVTVTGTENLMMAATLAEGTTVLNHCAREPEVVDLADYLNAMGANIRGAGTSQIIIEGVKALQGVSYQVIPDRIEAGTFMIGAAITQGDVRLHGANIEHNAVLVNYLRQVGVEISEEPGQVVRVKHSKPLQGLNVTTDPYPGFPTDLQAQWMVLNAVAQGRSWVKETIFENRFMHVSELLRMGANIEVDDHTAHIQGVDTLQGAVVTATDLRASASLILAGLVAKGTTVIEQIYHIDRGYERIEEKFHLLGGHIRREIQ